MTQDELFCSSQRQNQSFDSFEEEDEEIDVGNEDDSDEEVSKNNSKTRSSWLNCALRDDEAVYWVSIGHYEAVAVGN